MWNGVGKMPALQSCLSVPGVYYHAYNKAERAQRKLGHVTLVASEVDGFNQAKHALLKNIDDSLASS